MSSAGISFGGLASGLDTKAIISALVAVERRPILALETKKTSLNKQRSLFGDLGNLLEKLQTAAKALQTTTDFLQMKSSSDKENLLTATASSSATPGVHRVKVLQLAKAQVNSVGAADNTTNYGSGTVKLTVGGVEHFVNVGGTLQDIASGINAQQIGVSADVIDTGGTGPDRWQLVLRSHETGEANGFSIEVDTGPATLETLINGLEAGARSAAQDARLELNGIVIRRPTNSIADAVPGVTFELKSDVEPATEITVTVSTDAEETSKKVKAFVDAYNAVVDFAAAQSVVGENGTTKAPLFGDVTLRSIRSTLRQIVGGSVNTGNSAFSLLVQAGIKSDREGKLTFDQSKFESALVADEQAVASLFSAANGISKRLVDQIDVYTDSVDGLLKARREGFDRLIKDTQSRIDQSERRLEQYEKQLSSRFANLEGLLSQLQGQGSSLASFPTTRR